MKRALKVCLMNQLTFVFQFYFVRAYYSDEGIEYGIGRIPMAGTDFSTRTYSYDDVEGDVTLSNFNLAEEDFVYKVILYSLHLLKHSHVCQCV